jgi:hypothetical protein
MNELIEAGLDQIRAFHRKYYDFLPDMALDQIRAELNTDEHTASSVALLLERALDWEERFLTRKCVIIDRYRTMASRKGGE